MVGNSAENAYADDSLLSRCDRSLTKLEDFMSLVAAMVILGLMVFGTLNVIGRKVFSTPIWGYTDLVVLFMVAFSYDGCPEVIEGAAILKLAKSSKTQPFLSVS